MARSPTDRSIHMTVEKIDPPSLAPILGSAHISVAQGDTIIHISGQTGVDAEGNAVGTTFAAQATQALRNLATALDAAGATPADVVKLMIYIVDYTPDVLDPLVGAAIEVFGEEYPVTASTLLGVATLWQPEILIEVDAVAVI
jgi:enamine deaminase RidA (YjgF/YER057c/UK114 family)